MVTRGFCLHAVAEGVGFATTHCRWYEILLVLGHVEGLFYATVLEPFLTSLSFFSSVAVNNRDHLWMARLRLGFKIRIKD